MKGKDACRAPCTQGSRAPPIPRSGWQNAMRILLPGTMPGASTQLVLIAGKSYRMVVYMPKSVVTLSRAPVTRLVLLRGPNTSIWRMCVSRPF